MVDNIKKGTAPPGESFEIAMNLKTQKVRGKFSHNISLSFTEIDQKQTVILSGEVGGWCVVEPDPVRASTIIGEEKRIPVSVHTFSDCPVQELTTSINKDLFAIECTSSSARKKTVDVFLNSQLVDKPGSYSGEINFAWEKHGFKYILPVTIDVLPAYEASSNQILFEGDRMKNQKVVLDVRRKLARNADSIPAMDSIRIVNLPNFIKTTLQRLDKDNSQIIVELRCTRCIEPMFVNGSIELICDRSKNKTLLSIPVVGRIR